MKKLKIAIQMDPLEPINIKADSTFALGLEAQKRGYSLFHYLAEDLSMKGGQAFAYGRAVTLEQKKERHFVSEESRTAYLEEFDVILMRQDPPFDMAYITATHILEHVHPRPLVVNDPHHVRNAPEKLFVTHFPELMPPTLITKRIEEVRSFQEQHGDIIVKPLYGNGGAGVFHIRPDDTNLGSLIELFSEAMREPFIVQKYLPDVRKGDKRIILVDGEAVGALNRVPAKNEARSNLHVGGRAEASSLTKRDKEICATIGPALRKMGQIFVGIDIIGGWLTEINVTSPTGIQEIHRLGGPDIASIIWDAIEKRLGNRR